MSETVKERSSADEDGDGALDLDWILGDQGREEVDADDDGVIDLDYALRGVADGAAHQQAVGDVVARRGTVDKDGDGLIDPDQIVVTAPKRPAVSRARRRRLLRGQYRGLIRLFRERALTRDVCVDKMRAYDARLGGGAASALGERLADRLGAALDRIAARRGDDEAPAQPAGVDAGAT